MKPAFTVKEEIEFIEELHLLSLIEKAYKTEEVPKVRGYVAEMRKDLPDMVAFEYEQVKKDFNEACKAHWNRPIREWRTMTFEECERLERRMSGLSRELHVTEGKQEGFTPEQIADAREYPIGELLEVKRGNVALCPFHDDKHPSMDVRKNFWYCYTCGIGGDTIDLLMKRDKMTFREAVSRLSTG